MRLALVFTAALCAGLALVAAGLAPIIHLWLGAGAAVPGAAGAWLVATWISAAMFGQTLSYFLLGLGRLERVALPLFVRARVVAARDLARTNSTPGAAAVIL